MDDDILGARIRAAFESVAVPGEAQLLGARRARSGIRLVPLAVVAVALAVGVVWLALGTGSNFAEAWRAVPRPQDAWIIARAEQACGEGANPDKSDSGQPLDAGLPLSLVDARGNFAVAFFTDGQRFATCEFSWDRDGNPQTASSALGGMTGSPARLDVITAWGSSQGTYSMIVGHAGGAVAVEVDLGAGTSVTATVAKGYYLAWWPELDVVKRITGTDPSGKVVATLEQPVAP